MLYQQIARNKRKTAFLLVIFVIILALVGGGLGYLINGEPLSELWHIVEDMALAGQVPMPRVFIINDESPNAFATGRDPKHSFVAVTTGLRKRLNRSEFHGQEHPLIHFD